MNSNGLIVLAVLGVLLVVAARKWDDLKWWLLLGLVVLAVVTAFQLGMLDRFIPELNTPKVTW